MNPIHVVKKLPIGNEQSRCRPLLSREGRFLQEVIDAILDNLDNDQFEVPVLAQKVCLSVSQLNRRLKKLIDASSGQLIRNIRLQIAADLLAKDAASVGVIAFSVGYQNHTHFCRSFKRRYRCSPSEYARAKRDSVGSLRENDKILRKDGKHWGWVGRNLRS